MTTTTTSDPPPRVAVRPLRIGLIGFGTIGRGFHDLVEERGAALAAARGLRPSVAHVLVRDASRPRGLALAAPVTSDPAAFLAGDFDAVVEASGAVEGVEPVIRTLLARGVPVVTANKALVAEHGAALARVAEAAGTSFRFEASVAAGIPLFQLLERSLQSTRFRRVAAILNGTSNFVLTRLATPGGAASFEDALAAAQGAGFAEPDARDDVSGLDAARKLAILAGVLGGGVLPVAAIDTRGIAGVRPADCALAAAFGYRLKPLAVAELAPRVRAWVAPAFVPEGHPLANVDGESNGIRIEGDTIAAIFVSGPGAGARPTAAALLDDVLCATTGGSSPPSLLRRNDDDEPSPTTAPALEPWFLAVSTATPTPSPSDVAEFLGASGLAFVESRRLGTPAAITLAGITAPASSAHVDGVTGSLRRVPGIVGVRAFRVLTTEDSR